MSELVGALKRLLSVIGPRRIIGALGALYIALAVGRAIFQFSRGVSIENILIVTFLIAAPGGILLYGAYWISRAEIDARFYPDIAGWCLAGLGAMAGILLIYDFQPAEGISDLLTAPPILTALSSVAGFVVGLYDGLAKTRTRQLERRNRELGETQEELEETVARLEEANRRLEHYREYTDHVLNAVDDVFYVLDEDGTLQRWNVSLREVTGYSDAEIASMDVVEFFDTDDHDTIVNAIAEGFESGSAHFEAEFLTKGGEYVPYEFAASSLENPDGETVLAGIGRDLTMIRGLLDYSRVETGGEPFESVDLEPVLADVRDDLQFAIESSNATITTDTLPRVKGDPNQLRQLFQNLVENAIEYSGEEPPVVHVSARRNSKDWLIAVRDEGTGIAPEDQDKIFEIFQQSHARRHGNGTGIGLALCKRIIERHGGDIRIDSEPGEETTVQLTLPAIDEQSA